MGVDLGLTDSEYFRATGRADALGRRFAVLHGDAFGILYFPLGMAFHAISLHQISSLFFAFITKDRPFVTAVSSASQSKLLALCGGTKSSPSNTD